MRRERLSEVRGSSSRYKEKTRKSVVAAGITVEITIFLKTKGHQASFAHHGGPRTVATDEAIASVVGTPQIDRREADLLWKAFTRR